MTDTRAEKILAASHAEGLRQAYRQHAGTFRAWLIAFGVAFPVFLASNDKIWDLFAAAPSASRIAHLFLGGVAVQVLLALVDKYADLFCLSVVLEWRDEATRPAKFGVWWLQYDWPSILADCASVVLFGIATFSTLEVLLP